MSRRQPRHICEGMISKEPEGRSSVVKGRQDGAMTHEMAIMAVLLAVVIGILRIPPIMKRRGTMNAPT